VETQEVYKPREISHFDHYDLVVNNEQREIDSTALHELVNKIKEYPDIPQGELLQNGWSISIIPSSTKDRIWAKIGWRSQTNWDWKTEKEKNKNNPEWSVSIDKRRRYASESILNEMELANEIKTIVNSEEVQKIFREVGIEKVHFLEPIAGIINRNTRIKTKFYRFIKENIPEWKKLIHIDAPPKSTAVFDEKIERLGNVFKNHSIYPGDLDNRQFIVKKNYDTQKLTLYVIDTEEYYRL